MKASEIVEAWDQADIKSIHPTRNISESEYRESGRVQAAAIASVLPDARTVLDFGCGDGRVSRPLARLGYDVTAVDSSLRMLARIPTNKRIHSVLSDGDRLADKIDAPVDAVVCLAVLIHHDWDSGEQIVRSLAECVAPGGRMVLDWPSADRPEERSHWIGVTTWDKNRQARLVADLGMRPVPSTGMTTSKMSTPWLVYEIA